MSTHFFARWLWFAFCFTFLVCVVLFLGQIRPALHTPFFLLHIYVEVWRKKWILGCLIHFLVLLKCAFTVVISYGVVISSRLLSFDFMWCVPAKWTHELLFFSSRKSSLSWFSPICELWYSKGAVVLSAQSTNYTHPESETRWHETHNHAVCAHTVSGLCELPTHTETHKSYLLLF